MKGSEAANVANVDEERQLVCAAATDSEIAPIALRAPLSSFSDPYSRDVYRT